VTTYSSTMAIQRPVLWAAVLTLMTILFVVGIGVLVVVWASSAG